MRDEAGGGVGMRMGESREGVEGELGRLYEKEWLETGS